MISVPDAVIVVAGAILTLLGVAVAAFQRNRAGVLFAAFCVGYGSGFAKAGVTRSMDYASFASSSLLSDFLGAAATLLGMIGLLGLALEVPRGAPRLAPKMLFAAGLVGGALALSVYVALAPLYARSGIGAINAVNVAVVIFAFLVFPLRFAGQPMGATTARRTLALFAAGLALIFAGQGGDTVVAIRKGQTLWIEVAVTLALLLAVPLWLRSTRGPDGRLARNVALLIPAVLLVTMLVPGEDRAIAYAPGVFVGTLLLAYVLLRGDIEELDLKVRFAISKSTIAAVFIAVFFIASEAAQQFFGSTFSSAYVGIAAAGALVFAMAPLQRAAERLAEKAVPTQGAMAAIRPEDQRREEVFMKAARLALRGGLSRDEEVHLAELAEELGIGAGRAASLLRQAEREAGAGVV